MIKTFEEALNILGENHPYIENYCLIKTFGNKKDKYLIFYLKLRIIAKVLNGDWEPYSSKGKGKGSQEKWYPWFKIEKDSGFLYADSLSVPSGSYSAFGSRLCFKSKELAEYCGEQFIDLWRSLLISR